MRRASLNIDIQDGGGEWVLEHQGGCSWQHSLEECINLWIEYREVSYSIKPNPADWQIRNVKTGEIIPCAAFP